MANLVWATEQIIPGLTAKGVLRQTQPGEVIHQAIDAEGLINSAYIYRRRRCPSPGSR